MQSVLNFITHISHLAIKLTIIVGIVFFTNSCEKDCFENVGKDSQTIMMVKDFAKINFHHNFKIYLFQDTCNYVELVGKENLIANINANVSEQTLSFEDNNSCKLFKGYHQTQLNIHFKNLTEIFIDASPEIYSKDTLHFDQLFIENKGDLVTWDFIVDAQKLDLKFHAVVGKIKLNGFVNQLYLYTSGSNHCFFKDLVCNNAEINHTSPGNIYLTVKEKLNLSLNSSGSFYCYGNPSDTSISVKKYAIGKIYYEQ